MTDTLIIKFSIKNLNLSLPAYGHTRGHIREDTLVHDRPPEQMGLMYLGTHVLYFVSVC